MIARVGLLGRIMLHLLGALSLLVLATFALDTWQRRQDASPDATRFPRLDQAVGIVALLRDADPAQWPAILRAVSGEVLKAEIVDTAPVRTDLIREHRLEARLRRLTGTVDDRVHAFTDAGRLHRGVDPAEVAHGDRPRPMGRLATATSSLPDGRIHP